MTDSSSLTYVVESLPWAIGGFLAGVLTTRLIRHKDTIQEAPVTPPPSHKRHRLTLLHVIGMVLIVLTCASSVQAWQAQRDNERLTQDNARLAQCLASYSNAIADAIEVRSKASSEAQQAQDEMWRTLLQLSPGPESQAKARKVFQDYLDKRAQVAKAQQTNPYPPPPREVCPETVR